MSAGDTYHSVSCPQRGDDNHARTQIRTDLYLSGLHAGHTGLDDFPESDGRFMVAREPKACGSASTFMGCSRAGKEEGPSRSAVTRLTPGSCAASHGHPSYEFIALTAPCMWRSLVHDLISPLSVPGVPPLPGDLKNHFCVQRDRACWNARNSTLNWAFTSGPLRRRVRPVAPAGGCAPCGDGARRPGGSGRCAGPPPDHRG